MMTGVALWLSDRVFAFRTRAPPDANRGYPGSGKWMLALGCTRSSSPQFVEVESSARYRGAAPSGRRGARCVPSALRRRAAERGVGARHVHGRSTADASRRVLVCAAWARATRRLRLCRPQAAVVVVMRWRPGACSRCSRSRSVAYASRSRRKKAQAVEPGPGVVEEARLYEFTLRGFRSRGSFAADHQGTQFSLIVDDD